MIGKLSLPRSEKAALQRAGRSVKPAETRTIVFEKGRGTSIHITIRRDGGTN